MQLSKKYNQRRAIIFFTLSEWLQFELGTFYDSVGTTSTVNTQYLFLFYCLKLLQFCKRLKNGDS